MKSTNNIINLEDSSTVYAICEALLKLDTSKAVELIKKPAIVEGLINHTNHIPCLFAMHAIALALIGQDYSDILNNMTDKDIATLKKCIVMAKQIPQQDSDLLNKHIEMRKNKEATLPTTIYSENRTMIMSLKIASKICENAFWNDCVDELNKWTVAIDGFVRKPKETIKPAVEIVAPVTKEVATKKEPEYWPIKVLAEKLGDVKPSAIIYHVKNAKPRIKKLFKVDNDRWFFNSECFETYKKAFERRRTRTTNSVPAANTKPKTKKQKSTKIEPKQNKTLLDLKTLSAYIEKLVEMIKTAEQRLNSAKTESETLRNSLSQEQNEERINELLDLAKTANKNVVDAKQELQELTNKRDTAIQLHKTQQEAEQKLAEINKQITEFMTSTNQKHQ